MNLYIIEKYMGDIYDVMKIFNKKYNIEEVDIKQFYRLLASISIYAKFHDNIKKIFIK
jgi:triacylglycerol esterase/lipase EstA (alpha/beta hydrolase family)